jgi:hypothetical protein
VKADQNARGRYLGGKVPFGFRRGDGGDLVPHEAEQEAIREMVSLRAEGKPLRAITAAAQAEGPQDQPRGRGGRPESSGSIAATVRSAVNVIDIFGNDTITLALGNVV